MNQKLDVGQWVYIVQRVSNRKYLDEGDYEVSSAKIKRIGRKYVDVVNLSDGGNVTFVLNKDNKEQFWLSHYIKDCDVLCVSKEDVARYMETRNMVSSLRKKSDHELLNLYKQYKQFEKDGIIDDREFFKECRAVYPEKNKESIEYYAADMMREIARRWADMFNFQETNQYRPKVTSVSD